MSMVISAEPVPVAEDSDGVLRVGGTRVTVDSILHSFHAGATAEEIANQFPSLNLADIYAAISWYLHHRDLLDKYLAARAINADRVRMENESNFPMIGLRERLLARGGECK